MFLPLRGFSAIDREGEIFWNPAANAAFQEALNAHRRPHVGVAALDLHINDSRFALAVAQALDRMVRSLKPD